MSTWHCIRTATRQEQRVVDGLHDLAYGRAMSLDVYLPCETRWNRLSRIKTIKQAPLLPGYLFVRIDAEHLWRVNAIEGVYQILGWRDSAVKREVRGLEVFVTDLRSAEHAGLFDRTNRKAGRKAHNLKRGQSVKILDGPFGGQIGQIAELSGTDKVRVLLSLFGRETPVELEAREVKAQDTAPSQAA